MVATPPKMVPPAKVFNCPNCGGTIGIHNLDQSLTAGCKHCGSVVDVDNENLKLIKAAASKLKVAPAIEIGTKGRLFGEVWLVIGFMVRIDSGYSWGEYLLFNPTKGFRWLVEFDGHWNFVVTVKNHPESTASDQVNYLGSPFKLFHRGSATVSFVMGEFYWRVRVGERVAVEDFINPPQTLSKEVSRDETIWSVSTYVDHTVIKEAFYTSGNFPMPFGVAPNQPPPLGQKTPVVMKTSLYVIAALIVIQFLTVTCASNRAVLSETRAFNTTDVVKTLTLGPFTLDGHVSALEVKLQADVSNTWFGADMELVNEGTGDSVSWEQGVEYYSGYDSDGSWSEGSRSSEKIVSEVPGGRYRLVVETSGNAPANYSITVIRGVPLWSNFILGLLVFAFLPIFYWWRHRSFEARRWSTSDYSPYWSLESVTDAVSEMDWSDD